ncbi:MAG: hypothetical protein LLF83_06530, partial [Methanobacterium sp.]|nr:hypothetical protein [Methanobacterium sp.]
VPQCASALYSLDHINGKYLIVDIGGGTVDVALIEVVYGDIRILKYDTWFSGIRTVYSPIVDKTNTVLGLRYKPRDAEDILKSDVLKVKGVWKSLDFLDPIVNDYFEPIADELIKNYPVDTVPIHLCGGGSKALEKSFKKRFYDVTLMPDYQFANAIGYYNVGLIKYDKYINRKVAYYGR